MSEHTHAPDPRHPVLPPPPPEPFVDPDPPARYAHVGAHEIASGKTLAFLAYLLNFVLIPFWIVPVVLRNNEFALFHAKQSLMLWIYGIIGLLFCVGMIFAFGIGLFLLPLWAIFVPGENIAGMMNVASGRFQPLPIIGADAERSLAGIRKARRAACPSLS